MYFFISFGVLILKICLVKIENEDEGEDEDMDDLKSEIEKSEEESTSDEEWDDDLDEEDDSDFQESSNTKMKEEIIYAEPWEYGNKICCKYCRKMFWDEKKLEAHLEEHNLYYRPD